MAVAHRALGGQGAARMRASTTPPDHGGPAVLEGHEGLGGLGDLEGRDDRADRVDREGREGRTEHTVVGAGAPGEGTLQGAGHVGWGQT